MRGVGGPLLCIGDLLSDVGEEDSGAHQDHHPFTPFDSSSILNPHIQPSRLPNLFQENYDRLNEALGGTDHSWTSLTLELCNALETANKLVEFTNSHVGLLSEKVGELEKIIKRGDRAVAAAKFIHNSPNLNDRSQTSRHSTPPDNS